MSHGSKRFEIADIACGIADTFAEHGFRVFIDQSLDRGGVIGLCEAHVDPEPRQDVRK